MKSRKGLKDLVVIFFFFSIFSSVYLIKPMGLNNLASYPSLTEKIKIESSGENGTDVKALKAIISFAKRYLPIS